MVPALTRTADCLRSPPPPCSATTTQNSENSVMVYSKTYCPCECPRACVPASCHGQQSAREAGSCGRSCCRVRQRSLVTPRGARGPACPPAASSPPTPTHTHTHTDCSEVKSLFNKLGVSAKVVELDELAGAGLGGGGTAGLARSVVHDGGCTGRCRLAKGIRGLATTTFELDELAGAGLRGELPGKGRLPLAFAVRNWVGKKSGARGVRFRHRAERSPSARHGCVFAWRRVNGTHACANDSSDLPCRADGDSLQQALASVCGRRTVPQVGALPVAEAWWKLGAWLLAAGALVLLLLCMVARFCRRTRLGFWKKAGAVVRDLTRRSQYSSQQGGCAYLLHYLPITAGVHRRQARGRLRRHRGCHEQRQA